MTTGVDLYGADHVGTIVELDAGSAKARLLMSVADSRQLTQATNLLAAVFNMKGQPLPVGGHFKDDADWRDERARRMRLLIMELARYSRVQRKHKRLRGAVADSIDADDASYTTMLRKQLRAMEAENRAAEQPRGRIAVVPLTRKAPAVVRLSFTPAQHEYITHVALGARQADGTIRVFGGGELDRPIPVLAGHELRLGIRLTSGLLPAHDESFLPPQRWQKLIDAPKADPDEQLPDPDAPDDANAEANRRRDAAIGEIIDDDDTEGDQG
jgi:hypothetical protein